ncbi:hypothetical protein VPZ60_004238 [Salmonella enterica]|nr:hypothetical protein [Salmonella enterica]
MEQQNPVIGYRKLTDADIDLMNDIKMKGAELLTFYEVVTRLVGDKGNTLWADVENAKVLANAQQGHPGHEEALAVLKNAEAAFFAFQQAEPFRWAAIGRTDIQKGIMCLIRAVTQPDAPC